MKEKVYSESKRSEPAQRPYSEKGVPTLMLRRGGAERGEGEPAVLCLWEERAYVKAMS